MAIDEEYLLTCPLDVLQQMLQLMMLRRHFSVSGDSYESMFQMWPQWFPDFVLKYQGFRHDETSNSEFEKNYSMSFLDVLRNMKLNCEDQDHCSRMCDDIFAELRARSWYRHYKTMAHKAALAMVHFGSRRFLEALNEEVRTQGKVTNSVINKIIMDAPQPELLYTLSFNPNRIRRYEISKKTIRSKHRLTKKKWRRCQSWLKPMSFAGGRITQRWAASQLGRQLGAFTGKNMYQLLRKAHPHAKAFSSKKQRRCYEYTETGPGARSALNQLQQRTNVSEKHPGQAVADQFSRECIAFKAQWQKLAKAIAKDPSTPPELIQHAEYFGSNRSFDATWFQFVLCELSKVIGFIVYRRIIYSRGYWPM